MARRPQITDDEHRQIDHALALSAIVTDRARRICGVILRNYQQDMDDNQAVRQNASKPAKSRCNQSPTGSGKSHLIRQAAGDAPTSVVAIAHREFIVRQLAKLMPDAQVLTKGAKWDRRSKRVVGTVQTISRREPEDLPRPDALIVDECHHARGKQYQKASKLLARRRA